jgi:hypothetical protein
LSAALAPANGGRPWTLRRRRDRRRQRRLDLLSLWQFEAPLELVRRAIGGIETWPRWWPAVQSVQRIATPTDRWRVQWRPGPSWDRALEFDGTDSAGHGPLVWRTTAPIAGELRWEFEPLAECSTRVIQRWSVPQHGRASPWSARHHREAMRVGAAGLARHLGVNLVEAGSLHALPPSAANPRPAARGPGRGRRWGGHLLTLRRPVDGPT